MPGRKKRNRKKESAGPRAGRIAEPIAAYPAEPLPDTARLFWNGRSQAVRLPFAFRFEGDEVAIHREGDRVILEPLGSRKAPWPVGYWERLRELTRDFDFPDIEPMGGRLLDIRLDEPE